MAEDTEEAQEETIEEDQEPEKKRFKIAKPNPLVFIFLGPAIIIFVVYIVLSNFLISSDLQHEQKLELVLKVDEPEVIEEPAEAILDPYGNPIEEGGMIDKHTYYQFEVSFGVNVMKSKKLMTFDIAVSTFQPGVLGRFYFEGFPAFVPALRSDILYYMGRIPLEKLQEKNFQKEAEAELRNIINKKLESLGASPEIHRVFLQRLLIV